MTNKPDTEQEVIALQLLALIDKTPKIQSLLYDIGMLPEQCEPDTVEWRRMLAYPHLWQTAIASVQPEIDRLTKERDVFRAEWEQISEVARVLYKQLAGIKEQRDLLMKTGSERLGANFEKILHDNAWDLYEQ